MAPLYRPFPSPLYIVALLTFALAHVVRADEPLCGIQSVYIAAILTGGDPSFKDLLRPEFVGSERGSSIAELQRAAAKVGLDSLAVRNLRVHDLKSLRYPTILHVKTDQAAAEYDHFILFGGMDGPRAIIYDGVKPVARRSLAEVAAHWSGNALVLSGESIVFSQVTITSWLVLLFWGSAVALVLALAVTLQRFMSLSVKRASCGQQVVAILGVVGIGALSFHATSPTGFLVGPEAVREVRRANASLFLPKIDLAAARKLHRSNGAIFVDARSPNEYRAGHIPGAINVPAHSPPSGWSTELVNQSPDRCIVVYCSNSNCNYAYKTAQKLMSIGYENLLIFSGGWKEWQPNLPNGGLAN